MLVRFSFPFFFFRSLVTHFLAQKPDSIRLTRCAITINVMAFLPVHLVSSFHLARSFLPRDRIIALIADL